MAACGSCGTELPQDATFCPSCGASNSPAEAAPAAASSPPAASEAAPPVAAPPPAAAPPPSSAPSYASSSSTVPSGDAGGLLLAGAIGAFCLAGMALFTLVQMLARVRGPALVLIIAILGLGGMIGLGVGMMGYRRTTDNSLSAAAGITIFIAAALVLLRLVALFARSRGLGGVVGYGLPLVSVAAWTMVAVTALQTKDHLGDGMAKLIGFTILISAIWELISFFMMVGGAIRSFSTLRMMGYIGILFMVVKMVGIVSLGTGFLKLRKS